MSLTDGNLTAADIAAVVDSNKGNGFGDNGSGWWILLLFLFAMGGGGWGLNGGGQGHLQADIQRGFDQQATAAGIAGLSTQVGQGFADAAVANCQGNAAVTAAINGLSTTTLQGQNSLAMALQQCCCDNRQATADLKYTVAQENCADRQAISDGLRDLMAQNTANTNAIIQSQNQGFQGIQDKLCQLELDSWKQKAADQAAEIAALRGQVSQTAQTATITANNEAQTAILLQRLNPTPIPAYPVQNPNGCGCGVNFGCA